MSINNASRRDFLKAGAGLTLAFYLPVSLAASNRGKAVASLTNTPATLLPNAFVRIGADDSVTVIAKHLEMGQGTYTGLSTLVAEELDAAWSGEIGRRLAAYDRGEVQAIPAEQVFAELRAIEK